MPYGGRPATMSASEAPGTGPGTPQLPSKYSSSEHIKAYFLKTVIFFFFIIVYKSLRVHISAIELVVHREIFTASLFYSGLLDRHWAPEGERNRVASLAGLQTGVERTAPQSHVDSATKGNRATPQMSGGRGRGGGGGGKGRDLVRHLRCRCRDAEMPFQRGWSTVAMTAMKNKPGYGTEHARGAQAGAPESAGVGEGGWLHRFRHAQKGLDNKLLMGPF